MSRRVVITADDLGRDAATNGVIADLLDDGLVSATTLITVSGHSDAAAERMRAAGVVPHLHVTLTGERGLQPWHPLTDAASLRDETGALWADPEALGARGDEGEAVGEADAQLRWMRDRGLHPAAADSHAGTLYGLHGRSWLAAALAWCAENRLAFRLPRDPAPYFGGPLPTALSTAHARAVELADGLGVALPQTIATNRRSAADLGGYDRLRDDWQRRLAGLPEGTSELFLHPSGADAASGPDGILRVWEAQLLRDPVWRRALDAEGLDIVEAWWT